VALEHIFLSEVFFLFFCVNIIPPLLYIHSLSAGGWTKGPVEAHFHRDSLTHRNNNGLSRIDKPVKVNLPFSLERSASPSFVRTCLQFNTKVGRKGKDFICICICCYLHCKEEADLVAFYKIPPRIEEKLRPTEGRD
jgi:hypothetical protein